MKEFCCPKCGHNIAEEVMLDCCVSNEVVGVASSGDELEYGTCGEIDGGYIARYQCQSCGYIIPGVQSFEEMIDYINKNGKLVQDV